MEALVGPYLSKVCLKLALSSVVRGRVVELEVSLGRDRHTDNIGCAV